MSGCASLATCRTRPPLLPNSDEIHYIWNAPPVAQGAYQCGPAALESVIRRWGKKADAGEIGRLIYNRGTRGVLNFTLAQYARERGFWTEIRESNPRELRFWLSKGIPPIVMLHVGPFWNPTYHFVVLRGFNDREKIFYANTGYPEIRAIHYAHFFKKWKEAKCWTLIICPPEQVDWELSNEQAADLGFLSERSGRIDLAERWYQAALVKDPTSVPARFNLANVYLRTNRRRQAKKICQELFKENPAWAPASNNLAWICLKEGNPKEAVRIIETAFRHGAERKYEILDTLGLAYYRLKQYRSARKCFLEALAHVPPEYPRVQELIRTHLSGCPADPVS